MFPYHCVHLAWLLPAVATDRLPIWPSQIDDIVDRHKAPNNWLPLGSICTLAVSPSYIVDILDHQKDDEDWHLLEHVVGFQFQNKTPSTEGLSV